MAWVQKLMSHDYYDSAEKKQGLINRRNIAFAIKIKTAEQTLERLKELGSTL